MSPSEISDVLDPVHLEELCNITPLVGLGLLNKVGWALINLQILTTIHCADQNAVLE